MYGGITKLLTRTLFYQTRYPNAADNVRQTFYNNAQGPKPGHANTKMTKMQEMLMVLATMRPLSGDKGDDHMCYKRWTAMAGDHCRRRMKG